MPTRGQEKAKHEREKKEQREKEEREERERNEEREKRYVYFLFQHSILSFE